MMQNSNRTQRAENYKEKTDKGGHQTLQLLLFKKLKRKHEKTSHELIKSIGKMR